MSVKFVQGFFVFFLASVPVSFAFAFEVVIFTNYNNQPDFTQYGAKNGWMGPEPIRMTGLSSDHDFSLPGVWCGYYPLPSESAVKNHWRVKQYANFSGLIYDNLECWWPETNRLDDFMTMNRWYKEAIPNAKIGYYGQVPVSAFGFDYGHQLGAGPGNPVYDQWVANNNIMQPLADQVDVFFPSLYTQTEDRENWVKAAKAFVAEAKRIGNGKPVYPFINPRYAPPSFPESLTWQVVPKDYFRLQLDTLKAVGAAGVVIWGADNSGTQWSEDLPWWQATKKFLGW
ncbi:MAG: hypothetical protein MN733_43360 [Nitrososphaera sp.]|nr:hypothetical protein [Nitrososphaera sp.]